MRARLEDKAARADALAQQRRCGEGGEGRKRRMTVWLQDEGLIADVSLCPILFPQRYLFTTSTTGPSSHLPARPSPSLRYAPPPSHRAFEGEMARARQKMFAEQSTIRASLSKLRMSGAAFAPPPDVARSLEGLAGFGGGGGGGNVRRSGGDGGGGGGFHLVSMHSPRTPFQQQQQAGGGKRARVRPMSANQAVVSDV